MISKAKGFIYEHIKNGEKRKQFLRYLFVGVSCFLIETLIYSVIYRSLNGRFVFGILPEQVATSVSVFIMFWVAFLLNRNWSFKSKGNPYRQLAYNLGLFAIDITFQFITVPLLISKLALLPHMPQLVLRYIPELSKVILMSIVVMWNFVIFQTIVYNPKFNK